MQTSAEDVAATHATPESRKTGLRVALVGNPNAGKSSLFNLLTGMRQKVGNFPGVTVEKREGELTLPGPDQPAHLLDLPGLYSLMPRSPDEQVVTDVLLDEANPFYPDVVLLVADATNLTRSLFLASHVADLGLPAALVLTMDDMARGFGLVTSAPLLQGELGVPVVVANPRTGDGTDKVLEAIGNAKPIAQRFFPGGLDAYRRFLSPAGGADGKAQAADTVLRYRRLEQITTRVQRKTDSIRQNITTRLDAALLHPVWGYVIFLGVLFAIFQAVFALAAYPMDWIDGAIAWVGEGLQRSLPQGWLSRLLTEGLLPGIGGVLVFIPQIAILFGLIAVLEDTGYMARVIFISDKIMRRFGLSGRSVVPMFSGLACAVPAIMAARTIENRRERLLTILVTPFMSCSARLPVFTILTAISVPERTVLGFLSLQGLVLTAFYLLGTFFALASSWVLQRFVKAGGRTIFMLELPWYKPPRWQNVLAEMYFKSRTFVVDAGKVILGISLVLWFLAAYGPGDSLQRAERKAQTVAATQHLPEDAAKALAATYKLEASYAGRAGHWLEPAIRPLGFDWRIGISLIASFAAREVFVGTMATIHSVGQDFDDNSTLISRLRTAKDPKTGKPSYRPSVAFSLMIFYLLAMQCMSTFAIVRRETASWSLAFGQLVGMTALAWICSFVTFQVLERML